LKAASEHPDPEDIAAWKRWTQLTETKVAHQTTSGRLIWRSLGMLRAVRGLIVVSLLLGVVASALPYVSAAAFGPMMQVVADAGTSGNLSGVWDLRGPLPIWGFKEVRYGLPDVLLLRELFPQLRVVHVVRDPRDVLCSLDEWERSGGWSRVETERSLRHWLSVAGSFAATGTDPHLRSFILPVRYEDLVHFSQWWTNAVAEHCNLEADLLDKSVFDQWVHTAGPRGRADRQLREWSDLPASLRALIDDEDIQMVASTYGYDLSS
jgi:hypothetical protein